jgi:hypothetical protein
MTNLSLSPSTTVQTTDGTIVPLTGSVIRIETDTSGTSQATFPFVLTLNQGIRAFQDPGSGIAWLPASPGAEGGVLTVPLPIGQIPGIVTIRVGPLQGNDQHTTAPVLEIELAAGPVEVETVGLQGGTVGVLAALHQLPPHIAIDIQAAAFDSGTALVDSDGADLLLMGVAAIANAVQIETNLSEEIATASIEMAVDRAWAGAWPMESIRIVRVGAGDTGRVLETAFVAEDSLGRARFRADSLEGFSTFALVALGKLTAQESESGPPWGLWLGAGLGTLGVVGLAIGAFLLMSSQRRRPNT